MLRGISDKPLDQDYWDAQYKAKSTGWDLGKVSTNKEYIDTLDNKNCSILIPGCGNTYEAEYLLQEGFTNITVIDIAPTLVESLKQKFTDNSSIKIIQADFLNTRARYDLIIEQTFLRFTSNYASEVCLENAPAFSRRRNTGGLLFNRSFEVSPLLVEARKNTKAFQQCLWI
jgi:shikimate 5-dehydrogenase